MPWSFCQRSCVDRSSVKFCPESRGQPNESRISITAKLAGSKEKSRRSRSRYVQPTCGRDRDLNQRLSRELLQNPGNDSGRSALVDAQTVVEKKSGAESIGISGEVGFGVGSFNEIQAPIDDIKTEGEALSPFKDYRHIGLPAIGHLDYRNMFRGFENKFDFGLGNRGWFVIYADKTSYTLGGTDSYPRIIG